MGPLTFIFGASRSGTSWLGKIFDSHPATFYRYEPDKELRNSSIPFLCKKDDIVDFKDAARDYTNALMGVKNYNAAGSIPVIRKAYRSDTQHLLRTPAIYTLKTLGRAPILRSLVSRINVPDFADLSNSEIRPVFKSVASLGRAGLFLNANPGSKAVIIIRHPCGHIASVIKGTQSRHLPASAALAGIGNTEPAREFGLDQQSLDRLPFLEQLAWRWTLLNELALRQVHGNENAMVLKYESLCASPVEVAMQLFEFANLHWNQQSESFINRSSAPENRAGRGYFSINRDPMLSAMKWKTELNDESIDKIQQIVLQSQPGKLFSGDFS